MGLKFFEKIADPYSLKARLFPVFLALIPALLTMMNFYDFYKIKPTTVAFISSLGIFYLTMSISRMLGKRLESPLFEKWGGKPTTQILRHRDTTIDSITKARYHLFLSQHLQIKFPSEIDEKSDPSSADEVYESAVKWLLVHTRNTKTFNLLFQENISFGFYRNCLGLKPIAIVIAIVAMLFPIFKYDVIIGYSIHLNIIPEGIWISDGLSFIMLIIWIFLFNENTVKNSAFLYAEKLLLTCDVLQKKIITQSPNNPQLN